MKRYLGTLLCLLSTTACTHNDPPAVPPEAVTDVPNTGVGDMTPSSDGTLEPMHANAEPADGHDANPTSHGNAASGTSASGTSNTASGSSVVAAPSEPSPGTKDYKTLDASVPPDNTKTNKRDVKSSAVTPLDQGENQTDLDITKKIRQAVVGDKSLSFTAKNVKIITRDGKVTLRGPVNTGEERSAIQAAAQKVAGTANVDNQLEVKK